MTTWRNRLMAAFCMLLVAGAVSVPLAMRSQALAESPATAEAPVAPEAPADPPAVAEEHDGVWMEDETPEWHPIDLGATGHFKGYCENGQPVVTEAPKKTEDAVTILRPKCWGSFFMTEQVSKVEMVPLNDVNDPSKTLPVPPEDFSQGVSLKLNGYSIVDPRREKDVFPYITVRGRTLIPARWVVEAAGGRIKWNPDNQAIAIYWQDRVVRMRIGDPEATVNGQPIVLEQPPQIVAGRTMVPVRFVVEGLGGEVGWEPMGNTVKVDLEGAACPPAYCWEKQEEVQQAYNAKQNETE